MGDRQDNLERGPEGAGAAYSDAYYREAPPTRRACYGYNPTQCYARASEEPAPQEDKKDRGHNAGLIFAICAVCVLAVGLMAACCLYLLARLGNEGQETAAEREIYEILSDTEEESGLALTRGMPEGERELTAEEIYTRACECTVGVTVKGSAYNTFWQSVAAPVRGAGIVLNDEGYVLTNYHVIEDGYEYGLSVQIVTYDGKEREAEVVGVEPDSDLAVLKTAPEGLTAAEVGDSDEMRVGQTIYTVGNPLGELTYTMTGGIVSALDRFVTTDENVTVNMFQIDAAVNTGNSGGPVFNVYGQVIGVVTAKYTIFGMEGLGFAIPINDACGIACELVEKGYVSGKPYLGLTLAEMSPVAARYYDMVPGAYVYAVEAGSCGAEAGLCPGDVITAVDGTAITGGSQLMRLLRQYRAGDEAELTVWRDQTVFTAAVMFDEVLPDAASGEPSAGAGDAS